MAFNFFKVMWASSFGLGLWFKEHPNVPQVLDLGLGSNNNRVSLKHWTWVLVPIKAIINGRFIRLGHPKGKI
jgi:hypothetical protein